MSKLFSRFFQRTLFRNHSVLLIAGIGSILITLPFFIRQSSWSEWGNPYWMLLQQRSQILHSGTPSYLVHSDPSGMAYPHHVFYAGFTLSVMAYLSVVIPPWVIFCMTIALGFCLMWVGSWRLLHVFTGHEGGRAFLISTCLTFSPYLITNVYGRGAWAEHLGSSAAIFCLGSLFGMPHRSRFGELCAPVFGALLLFGTHNISVLLFAASFVFVAASAPRDVWAQRPLIARRLLGIGIGAGLTSAFFLPNLYLSSRTRIAHWHISGATAQFDSLRVIFSPFLFIPKNDVGQVLSSINSPRLFAQTAVPLFFVASICIGGQLSSSDSVKKVLKNRQVVFLLVALSGLTAIMTHTEWWLDRLGPLYLVQFPFRLHPYLALVLALLVACLIDHWGQLPSPAFLTRLLMFATLWTLTLAAYQVIRAQRTTPSGYGIATHQNMDKGELSPVFRIDAAAPTQFRLEGTGYPPPADSVLYFGDDGHLLPSISTEFMFPRSALHEIPVALVTFGSERNGTAVGVGSGIRDVYILVDRWGQTPKFHDLHCAGSTCKVQLIFERAIGRLIIRESGHSSEVIDGLVGMDGQVGFLRRTANFTTMTDANSNLFHSRSSVSPPLPIDAGEYKTNVVASPFSEFVGADNFWMNSEGTWNVRNPGGHVSWRAVNPVVAKIGRAISILSLVLFLFLAICQVIENRRVDV